MHTLTDVPIVTSIAPDALARLCARSREGLLRPGTVAFDAILRDVLGLAWSGGRPPAARQAPRACHPAALRAARLLRESDDSLSMSAVARRGSLSRERLSRVFTQCFGIGLVQYRNHQLVQRFIHNYGHGSYANMLRAALDVGFGSYAQFHRAFKQVTGYPPATHIERVRDGIVDPTRTG
jgi:AraC-like DNA-binding protein